MSYRLQYVECKISNGQSLSPEINLSERDPVAIIIPAWTAANLTFQSAGPAFDGARASTLGVEPFQDVFDSAGVELSITVTANKYVALTEAAQFLLRGLARTKVRSGTTGTPVAQGADRILTFVCQLSG